MQINKCEQRQSASMNIKSHAGRGISKVTFTFRVKKSSANSEITDDIPGSPWLSKYPLYMMICIDRETAYTKLHI